jgi:zona occludens toxin
LTNINGLTLDHSPLPPLESWTKAIKNQQGTVEYEFTFPPNAIIVVDECQKFYRPRSNASAVPPHVQALETHRHSGIDFLLMTQGTHLVDHNLKTLVKGGKHIYLKATFLGRFSYEAKQCINENEKSDLALAARKRYKLPKDVFNLYKSAELHTKPPRVAIPFPVIALVLILISLPFIGYYIYHRVQLREHPVDSKPVLSSSSSHLPKSDLTSISYNDSLIPVDIDNPASAPIYQESKPLAVAPQIIGCIASKSNCTCYTQQSTPVTVPANQCFARSSGKYYDPYHQNPTITASPSLDKIEDKSGSGQGSVADRPKTDLKQSEPEQAKLDSIHLDSSVVNTQDL